MQRNNFAFEVKYAMNIPTNSLRLKKSPGVLLLKCSSRGGHMAFCCSEMSYTEYKDPHGIDQEAK